jgi:hypothetical protein
LTRGAHEIAFHGFDDPEIPFDILIGGAATVYLKQDIELPVAQKERPDPPACNFRDPRTSKR